MFDRRAAGGAHVNNTMKDIWASGGVATGGWLSLPDTISAELLARMGFDYLCIDMQHGLSDYSTAVEIIQTLESSAPTTIARVPWNEPGIIGRTLDAGALGVVIPMVNTPEQAVAAVRSCRYPPAGSRSWGPTRIAGLYESYSPEAGNDTIACIPMIETAQAVDNLDAILSLPGIDAIYVGPADLSISLGMSPASDNDGDFAEAIDRILEACARHDVVPGIHTDPGLYGKRREQGFRMITVLSDTQALVSGAEAMLDSARKGTGDESALY